MKGWIVHTYLSHLRSLEGILSTSGWPLGSGWSTFPPDHLVFRLDWRRLEDIYLTLLAIITSMVMDWSWIWPEEDTAAMAKWPKKGNAAIHHRKSDLC